MVDRMDEHSRDTVDDSQYSAVHRHNAIPGHIMDLKNLTPVFISDWHQTKETLQNIVVFALIPLENKAFAKTLRKLYKKDIFRLSGTIRLSYGATHETLTNVK